MEQKKVVGNYVAQWGEGPIWVDQALYYVDIEKHKVLRYLPEVDAEESWDVGERVGTVVPRESGGLVIAGDRGFSFLDDISGEVQAIFGCPRLRQPPRVLRSNLWRSGLQRSCYNVRAVGFVPPEFKACGLVAAAAVAACRPERFAIRPTVSFDLLAAKRGS